MHSQVEAFELTYLNRVIDVKDTKHKVSLMTHLVELVTEQFAESTDLYSELPHVHRVAKVRAGEWSTYMYSVCTCTKHVHVHVQCMYKHVHVHVQCMYKHVHVHTW